MAEEPRATPPEPSIPQPQPGPFPTDATTLSTIYTNFCRVSITPEELVLDFGLNTQMAPNPNEPIRLSHRVVMNFYTAKRVMNALLGVINQYESTYGVLELDFQRRARNPRPGTGGQRPGGQS